MKQSFGSIASYAVIEELEKHGHEAVFVGGAVRDYLRGQNPTDIDIATSAEPEEVKAIFSNTVDVGIAHGTILVIVQKEPIEVTTYRTEGSYTDARRPDAVTFVKSLREDLLRRDFTMNALAITSRGELVDLFGGQADMEQQLIRAVGTPIERFQEDALRMVRAVRFASTLGFSIEEATFKAIQDNATRIQFVSVERIKIEMDKLFVGEAPQKAFHYLQATGLDRELPLFPIAMQGLEQSLPFTTALEGWAYLAITGNFEPEAISRAYKLSNDEQKFIAAVVKVYKLRLQEPFTVATYYQFDIAVLQTTEKFYRAMFPEQQTFTAEEICQRKNDLRIQSKQDLAVNGKDLMEWAGMRSGRWTGEWMQKIEEAVLHGRCENNPITIKEWFIHDFKSER